MLSKVRKIMQFNLQKTTALQQSNACIAIQRDKYFAPKAKNEIATHMSRSGNSGGSNLT